MPNRFVWHARRERERGAVAVETALMSMVLVMILGGVIDTSMLFRDSLAVASATRAAARTGASEPLAATFASDVATQAVDAMSDLDYTRIAQLWVYKADVASGAPASGWGCASNCFKFTVSASGTLSSPTGSWSARRACADSMEALGVYVEYRHPSTIGMFFDGQRIRDNAIMQFEPVPSSTTCVSS